jgi:hypothetical protein
MKRISLVFLLVALLGATAAQAGYTKGGLPWSLAAEQVGYFDYTATPLVELATPDYEKAKALDAADPGYGSYRAGLVVQSDLDINRSGKLTFLPDGRKIWSLKVAVDGALAMDLFYDRFHLPEGVSLFLMNGNGRQIVGAIDQDYNPEDGIYTTTSVQGNTTFIELDIAPGVPLSSITFHIDRVAAHYRGGMQEVLNERYADVNKDIAAKPTYDEDMSDPCEINAVCPPEGTTYANLKQTAAHSSYAEGQFLAFCSGNLMNNTSNDCSPLYLTASHCEGSSSTSNSTFSAWKFYFNYEYALCTGNVEGSAPMDQYITGATFKARSAYNSSSNSMIGDFLLLKLNDLANRLGNEYNAYLAGWDRASLSPGGKFIDFSHPRGDPKKVTVFSQMQGNGDFNGGAPGSHWSCKIEKGGIEGGSSGSGIFSETTGRLFGDLSGGPVGNDPCDTSDMNRQVYSKLYLNWEYINGGDGTPQHRLKDWLDPAGTDAMFINTIKKAASGDDCLGDTTISVSDIKELDHSIQVYPNPSSGILRLKVNLKSASDLTIRVTNILGQQVGRFATAKMQQGEIKLDLSAYANGVYVLSIQSDKATVSKKIILQR